MTLSLPVVLAVSAVLFGIGVYGALTLRNAIRILMCVELIMNSVNINLVAFSRYVALEPAVGHAFTIFILAIAAAETAIGLAIILMISRQRAHIDVERINLLKW